MDSIINLNVGGKFYTTSISTLTKYPDSMLGRMFGGDLPSAKDAQGNVVIDRDGELFRYVLTFLRSSKLILPENFNELALLKEEAEFYQIPELTAAVRTYPLMKDVLMLNVGGTIFPVLRKYLQPDNWEELGEAIDLNKTFDFKRFLQFDRQPDRFFYQPLLVKNSPHKDQRLILGNVWETICSPNAVKDQHGNYIIDGNPQLFGHILHFIRTKRFFFSGSLIDIPNNNISSSRILHQELQSELFHFGIHLHLQAYLDTQAYVFEHGI